MVSDENLIEQILDELGSLQRTDKSSEACAHSTFPTLQSISMRRLSKLIDSKENQVDGDSNLCVDRLMNQLRNLTHARPCPILAVTGLLNAGKTSLLAGFLSPEGRKRVLIGSANDHGTHRFVMWLPESWRQNPSIWNSVVEQLVIVFGCAPEPLSYESSVAARQYNGELVIATGESVANAQPVANAFGSDGNRQYNGEQMISAGIAAEKGSDAAARTGTLALLTPLLATDPALDQFGIGLMDCPDIQTGIVSRSSAATDIEKIQKDGAQSILGTTFTEERQTFSEKMESIAARRADLLDRAVRVCSAFLVVMPSNAIQEKKSVELLESLKREMPGLGRMLAINRVQRRYTTQEIADEVNQTFGGYGFERAYLAYNYDGPNDRQQLPIPPDTMQFDSQDPLPVFFQIAPPPATQPPTPVPLERFLISLGSQLDQGKLVQDCQRSLASQLNLQLSSRLSAIQEFAIRRHARIGRLQNALAKACVEFSAVKNQNGQVTNIRLQASKEIIKQLADSLEMTAPWWAYPGQLVDRTLRSTKELVSKSTSSFVPFGWLSSKTQQAVDLVRGKMRSGQIGKVVSAQSLETELRRCDLHGDLRQTGQQSLHDRDSSLLVNYCQQMIDRFQLESQTRLQDDEVLRYTTELWANMTWGRRLWTGIAPATLLVAPLLAVILLPFDFGGSSVLVFASMKELLLAAGIGAAVAALQPGKMPKVAEDEAAWQQLCDLYAIGCDTLALPRPVGDEFPAFDLANEIKRMRASPLPVKLSDLNRKEEGILENQPLEVSQQFLRRMNGLLAQLLELTSASRKPKA